MVILSFSRVAGRYWWQCLRDSQIGCIHSGQVNLVAFRLQVQDSPLSIHSCETHGVGLPTRLMCYPKFQTTTVSHFTSLKQLKHISGTVARPKF